MGATEHHAECSSQSGTGWCDCRGLPITLAALESGLPLTTGEGNTAEWTSLPCLNDALAYAIVHGYPSDLAHAALRERQQADTAGQPDETGAYIEVNERGTPLLYFPDGDHEDGVGCREATVAEWSFWRAAGRLREQVNELSSQATELQSLLDAARQALEEIEAKPHRAEEVTARWRAALGVEGPAAGDGQP